MPSTSLGYVPSTESNPSISSTLPQQVISCLENARFLHLATCTNNEPHISLMNYTYLPSTPFPSQSPTSPVSSSSPTIIMTMTPSSRKISNLISNPKVSMLVHDWGSLRPPTTNPSAAGIGEWEGSPLPRAQGSSLASLLLRLNTAALGRISVTINGTARVLEGGEEEAWCREKHIENHQSGEMSPQRSRDDDAEDGGTECYVEGDDVKVVVVTITGGRIADSKGGVREFIIGEDEQDVRVNGAG